MVSGLIGPLNRKMVSRVTATQSSPIDGEEPSNIVKEIGSVGDGDGVKVDVVEAVCVGDGETTCV